MEGLINARRLHAALSLLVSSPCTDPDRRAEIEGQLGTVQGLDLEAASFHAHKNDVSARDYALKALAIAADDTDASTLLDELSSPADPATTTSTTIDPYVAADRLYHANNVTEAQSAFVDAVKAGKPIPSKYRNELDNRQSIWEWVRSHFESVVWKSIVAVLAAATVSTVWTLTKKARLRNQRTLFTFKDGAGDDAGEFGALTRVRLREVTESTGIPLQFYGNPETAIEIPALGDLDPRLKPLDALVALAVQSKPCVVTVGAGKAGDSPQRRFAVLEVDRGEDACSTSIQLPDLPDDSAELHLAASYAAGWLVLTSRQVFPSLRPSDTGPDPSGIPTTIAPSYGWLLAGNAAMEIGEHQFAGECYGRSLQADNTNLSALASTAISLAVAGDLASLLLAINILSNLIGEGG